MAVSKARRKLAALKKAGFLPFERKEFLKTTRITSRGEKITVAPASLQLPYIKKMIRDRAKAYRHAVKSGMSIRNYTDSITDGLYREQGLVDKDNFPDFWALYRKYRDEAIEDGSYDVPKKKRIKQLDKGDVAKQKARWRARQAAKKDQRPIGRVVFNEETGKFEAEIY